MSLEQEEIEVTDTPEAETVEIPLEETPEATEEQAQEQPQEEKKPFNPKTDKVEFTTPEQQERFNAVYRDLKKSDSRNQMLTDFLAEQQRQLDELRGFTQEIKAEKLQSNEIEAERALMAKITAARAEGNDEAYDLAMKEYVEFASDRKFEKKFNEKVNEFSKKEQLEEKKQAEYVESLMSEKDDTGEFKRPWLQENHPDFSNAIQQLAVIAYKYTNDPNQLQKSLNELDQVMGVSMPKKEKPPVQTRAPNPMQGTNLTNHKPQGKIKMTRKEADILAKLERHSGRKIDLKKYDARRAAMYEAQNKGGR